MFLSFYFSLLSLMALGPQRATALRGHLTPQDHAEILSFLKAQGKAEFKGGDKWTDTVTQVAKGTSWITYHIGDPATPVFISYDNDKAKGAEVVLLRRGDDYLHPEDRQSFIILFKKAGSEYLVHKATLWYWGKHPSLDKVGVVWSNCRIEQHPNASIVLDVVGDQRVQKFNRGGGGGGRPRCGWVSSTLLCQAEKKASGKGRTDPPLPQMFTPNPLTSFEDALKGKEGGGTAAAAPEGAGGKEEEEEKTTTTTTPPPPPDVDVGGEEGGEGEGEEGAAGDAEEDTAAAKEE